MKTMQSLLAVFLLAGCSSLLPTAQEKSVQPWGTFEEAKASYDRIEPFVTDMATVRSLGFDPFKTPNFKILNHAQVVQTVLPPPIQGNGAVPAGILACIKAQDACQGYYMEPRRLVKDRVGNFMLDFMNFKRETVTTGWKFGALIVIVGDKVVYKQWSGSPNILEETVQKNPLGPFQGMGSSSDLYR
ncbi:MAG: hypothetical protein MUE86_01755 [Thiobacillaceae bacterium]|jgi:hypothetical protein|nr:hypothetical protein [Thiobacillaceae bacterium]